jgi:hypothetical protein
VKEHHPGSENISIHPVVAFSKKQLIQSTSRFIGSNADGRRPCGLHLYIPKPIIKE